MTTQRRLSAGPHPEAGRDSHLAPKLAAIALLTAMDSAELRLRAAEMLRVADRYDEIVAGQS